MSERIIGSVSTEVGSLKPERGLVVIRVDEQGRRKGEPLLVSSVFYWGNGRGEIDHLNVVPLTIEEGKLGYRLEPQKVGKREKVYVLANLHNIYWAESEEFFRPLDEYLRENYTKDAPLDQYSY